MPSKALKDLEKYLMAWEVSKDFKVFRRPLKDL